VPEAQGLRDTSIIGSDPKAVRTPATSLLQSGLLNSSIWVEGNGKSNGYYHWHKSRESIGS